MLGFAVLAGAPLGVVAINVLLAGAAGGMAALVLARLRYGKVDVKSFRTLPDLRLLVAKAV